MRKKKRKERKQWILLFDNVDSFETIQPFFPNDAKAWGEGRVLITTRNHHIGANSQGHINTDNMVTIAPLEPEEQFGLFTQIIYDKEVSKITLTQKQAIENFLKQLAPFPLDISSAAYHIKNSGISYQEYLDKMRVSAPDKAFKQVQSILMQEMIHYAKVRYNIITETVNQLIKINAEFEPLLFMIGMLNSQNIPIEFLEKISSKSIVHQFLITVRNYSFMTFKTEADQTQSVSIHRSIQEIMGLYLKNTLPDEKKKVYLENILQATEAYCKPMVDAMDFGRMRQFLPHLSTLAAHKCNDSLYQGGMELILGSMYAQLGDPVKALECLDPSVKNLSAYYGSSAHPRLLRALTYAGIAEKEVGNYSVAQKLLENSVTLRDKNEAVDQLELALTLRHLFFVYRSIGDFEKGLAVITRSIDIYQKNAPEDPNLALAFADLASVYHDGPGDYDKAIEYRTKAFSMLNKRFGPEYMRTIFVQGVLGMDYRRAGRYQEMIQAFKKSYDIYSTLYGYSTFYVLWITINLGDGYSILGLYDQANPLLLNGYDQMKQYYGSDHIHTDLYGFYVGRYYLAIENYAEAQKFLEKSLKGHIKNFGENHYKVSWISSYLANVYVATGDYKKAQELFEKTLRLYEKQFGKDHLDYAIVVRDFAHMYMAKKDYAKAETMLNDALVILQKNKHPEAYKCFEYLGDLYVAKGQQEKATTYYQEALKIARDTFPKESAHIARLEKK